MKKILFVIIGVFAGITVSSVAYGEINWWDETVTYFDTIDWNDVFNPNSEGQDLYLLVYDKVVNAPERDALKEVAKMYGLTKDEADRVVNGSITPIFNNPDISSAQLTQEDAYILVKNLQDDFTELSEIFELEKEIDVSITPSELFANGDLSDSGFDLVYDLSVIEEIMFLESSDNTVGLPFDDQLKSPVLLTEEDQTISDYVSTETPAAILGFQFDMNNSSETSGSAISTVGDEEFEVEVLEEDICPADDSLSNALEDYYEKESEDETSVNGTSDDGTSDVGALADETGSSEDIATESYGEDGALKSAPADDWSKSWCPSLIGEGDTGTTSGNTFGEAGFSSLSDIVSSVIDQSTGAAAWGKDYGIAAQIAVCFDTEFVEKRVSSYLPGDSCILCEVDKINGAMDKTLQHSLIPNKVTGNLMESAKCKEAYGPTPWFDMQIISIAVPVPTPPNDDVIFGKNIFEEWKKYVDRYQPYLYPNVAGITETELDYALPDATQEGVLNSVNAVLSEKQAEAKLEIEATEAVNDGTNMTLYTQTILTEIRQMRNFFEGYLKQYNKIGDELCPDIKNKKDVD
jgi:hypothetical protein